MNHLKTEIGGSLAKGIPYYINTRQQQLNGLEIPSEGSGVTCCVILAN